MQMQHVPLMPLPEAQMRDAAHDGRGFRLLLSPNLGRPCLNDGKRRPQATSLRAGLAG